MAKIAAICISDVRGIQKHEIPEAFLKKDWGIEGDAHAGNWHRQVSLLSVDSVAKLQEKLSFELKHGAFAENILVEGMAVHTLPVGTKLRIGRHCARSRRSARSAITTARYARPQATALCRARAYS